MSSSTQKLTAVVFGGTGAIGEELVKQLVVNPEFKKVVTLGRREVPGIPTEGRSADLVQKTINMDNIASEATEELKGADVVFCTLGTTRKVAGSAEAFKRVDYEYPAAAASAAKAAGVKHFSLVTAQGANHKVYANDLALFHPLLYMKTKGLAEQAALQQGFPRVSIFRPGMLERGDKARPAEKWFGKLATAIDVKDVARLMILDAVRDAASVKPVMTFEMSALLAAAAKQGVPPAAK